MGNDSGPGTTHLLKGQLDPNISAKVAIIHSSDSPGRLCSFGVVVRMVVEAIVS
jgi:hypothetical protein